MTVTTTQYHVMDWSHLLVVRLHGFDEKPHPGSLVTFSHGHHDRSRLAVDLCPFILGRKGKLEVFKEGNDHDLHLKDSVGGFIDQSL